MSEASQTWNEPETGNVRRLTHMPALPQRSEVSNAATQSRPSLPRLLTGAGEGTVALGSVSGGSSSHQNNSPVNVHSILLFQTLNFILPDSPLLEGISSSPSPVQFFWKHAGPWLTMGENADGPCCLATLPPPKGGRPGALRGALC